MEALNAVEAKCRIVENTSTPFGYYQEGEQDVDVEKLSSEICLPCGKSEIRRRRTGGCLSCKKVRSAERVLLASRT